MATKKIPVSEMAQVFKFDPHIIADPVPWPIFTQLDRATQIQLAQARIDLHKTVLKAQLDAADKINQVLSQAK